MTAFVIVYLCLLVAFFVWMTFLLWPRSTREAPTKQPVINHSERIQMAVDLLWDTPLPTTEPERTRDIQQRTELAVAIMEGRVEIWKPKYGKLAWKKQ